MSIKRCYKCKGSKMIMTLGALERKCLECKGTGRQIKVEEKEVDEYLSAPENKKEKGKRGRPAKVRVEVKEDAREKL